MDVSVTTGVENSVTLAQLPDGSWEHRWTGCVWVLRHDRIRHGKLLPGEAHAEHLLQAVFWSKEAGFAYVKREYGIERDEWTEGTPEGTFPFVVIITADQNEELHLALDATPVWQS